MAGSAPMEDKTAGNMPMEESLIQLLKCVVCMEQVDVLKALPCQHTICLCCVIQLTIRENRFKCPTCNKEHAVPNGGLDELPNSLLSQQIADIVNARQQAKLLASAGSGRSERTVDAASMLTVDAASMLTANGGFGFVPTTAKEKVKPAKTSPRESKSKRSKQTKAKTSASSKSASKAEVSRLKQELQQAYDKASSWCKKADEMVNHHRQLISLLEEKAEGARDPINKHEDTMVKLCQEKISGVDKGARDKEAELRSYIQRTKSYTVKLDDVLNDALGHSKLVASPEVTASDISEAQDKLFSLKQLNCEVRRADVDIELTDKLYPGDCVRLKPYGEQWTDIDKMVKGKVSHASVGVFHELETEEIGLSWMGLKQQTASVIFPEEGGWKRSPLIIEKALTRRQQPYIGDRVKVASGDAIVDDDVSHQSVGRLVEIHRTWGKGCLAKVEIPDSDSDMGRNLMKPCSSLEVVPGCPFEVGDKVRVNSDIQKPHRGWGGVNASSVGKISSIDGPDITANFAECNNWVGSTDDLELVRVLRVGDRVQVKLSIECTGKHWKGITHRDVGVIQNISEDYDWHWDDYTNKAKVLFGKTTRRCDLDEIELARYQIPAYDRSPCEEEAASEPTELEMFDLAGTFMQL